MVTLLGPDNSGKDTELKGAKMNEFNTLCFSCGKPLCGKVTICPNCQLTAHPECIDTEANVCKHCVDESGLEVFKDTS